MGADEEKPIQTVGRAELGDPAEECKQGLSESDRLKIPEKYVPQNQLSGAHRGSQSEEAISEPVGVCASPAHTRCGFVLGFCGTPNSKNGDILDSFVCS